MTEHSKEVMERRRALFEAFCLSGKGGYSEQYLERDNQGNYFAVWESWRIWNAALDSVVIELPKDIDPSEMEGLDDRPLMNAAAVQAAIESSGLKVKP